jgi:hypothetical protein
MKDQRMKARLTGSKKFGRFAWMGIIVAIFALGATAAVSLRTGDAKSSELQLNSQKTASRTGSNARQAAGYIPLNSQTGQIRPLRQDEAQKLADGINKLVSQSTEGLQPVRHADGSVELDLEGRFQNIAVVRRNADGTVSQSCVDNPKAAADFFGIDPQLVGVPAGASLPSKESAQPEKGVER